MEILRSIREIKMPSRDQIGTGAAAVVMGGLMGAPTSGLLIGYIGEIINNVAGRPLGEWGGWKVGFGVGEAVFMAAAYEMLREGQRQYDRRRWELPRFK